VTYVVQLLDKETAWFTWKNISNLFKQCMTLENQMSDEALEIALNREDAQKKADRALSLVEKRLEILSLQLQNGLHSILT